MSMLSILSASQSLMKMQTMQASNTKTQGQINVLKSEIETDGDHALESKKEKVEELEKDMVQNTESLMNGLNEINDDLKPSEKENAEKTESQKEPNMDKVEISPDWKEKAAAGETVAAGEAATEKIPVGTPVTYKPVGDKIIVTPQISNVSPATSSQGTAE